VNAEIGLTYLDRLVDEGYLQRDGEWFVLSESGLEQGAVEFATSFSDLTRPAHGECSDDCWCHASVRGSRSVRRGTSGTSALMDTPPEHYDFHASLPRSYLRPCLLLLLAEDSSHGYELLEQLRELGLRIAEPGGMYRALRSMDEDGLVRSWWEPSQSGPARRLTSSPTTGDHRSRPGSRGSSKPGAVSTN
jgi:hypothetical protein